MVEYRKGAHTVFEINLHLVWITKYRRPALQGEVATRVRDLIRDICGQHEVSIMKGHVSKDHVHLLISLPPQVTISRPPAGTGLTARYNSHRLEAAVCHLLTVANRPPAIESNHQLFE